MRIADYARGVSGEELPDDQSEIIFMGTGTSEGIPRLSCLTNPLKKCEVSMLNFQLKYFFRIQTTSFDCSKKGPDFDCFFSFQVCSKAAEPGNVNRRLNTSILIRFSSSSGKRHILIDAGK